MKKAIVSIYLGLSLFILIGYFGLLYEKIMRPDFKNLSNEGFIFWGFIVAIVLGLDVFIISRLFSKKKKIK